jgi:hypothetical protein
MKFEIAEFLRINERLLKIQTEDDFKGYDLFDGLNSKIFNAVGLNKIGLARLAWIQFHKRSPINFRRLFLVNKERNPKGIALIIQGLIQDYHRTNSVSFLEKAINLGDWLLENKCDRAIWIEDCWGYHFPWEARAFYVPLGTPNIISTTYVSNALLSIFEVTGEKRFLDSCDSTAKFLLAFNHIQEENKKYFTYIPGETVLVHNANLWGAATLVRIGVKTNNSQYISAALKAAEISVNAQSPEGFWRYGELKHHQFIDGFHTGYNLECLALIQQELKSNIFETQIKKGFDYYKKHFFLDDGTAKYYHDKTFPIDMHSVAQAVITCIKVGKHASDIDFAIKIAEWSIRNMYSEKTGLFVYQKNRFYVNKIPYFRWTQAWVYYSFALLNNETNK